MREELEKIVKLLKRRKAPGPDEIPTELRTEMDEEDLENVSELITSGGEMKS